MMHKQAVNKNKVHSELQLRYKEYFESQLAIHLLKHCEFFPSVNKISQVILNLMLANKDTVLNVIKESQHIITEMRIPYFGACFDETQLVSPDLAYSEMLNILGNKQMDLSRKMQVHCIFVHRIYNKLINDPHKSELSRILFPSSLFSRDNRSRIEKKDALATNKLGIAKHPVFANMLEKSNENHMRALDKFELDENSNFYKSVTNIPSVCGPSGHTGSLLLGTQLLFTEEFLLAVNSSHPLAKLKIVKQQHLTARNLLLLDEGHCMRDQALALCSQMNIPENREFRATSLETLRHMVLAGIGITLMPKLSALEKDQLVYIPFVQPKPTRSVALCWRMNTSKQIVLKSIMATIKTILKKHKSVTIL